ncbi:uncharacterized protein Dwil_GK15568 [Drosophila willistoni]|uniref:Uncharacterized protein n=1 Tax=Drosophila willistoni TaxID=7260 RepID=B4MX12_DROWI|nr:basic-leucine zipper transcription factor A [Drosophila willistoni]EDW76651.1 uncharacterized protein Dwil_GK15568 [Drosophila willistoni]
MAPSNVDYQNNEMEIMNYNHKKFEAANYTHKKFGKKSTKEVTTTPLFRPYALSENTPRKRRQREEQTHVPQHQLPPTPPTTPPQIQQQQQQSPIQQQYAYKPHPDQQRQQQQQQQSYLSMPINHQAYSLMLQKQRAVLQMRQLLSINPDANTWPLEWRQALQSLLQQ